MNMVIRITRALPVLSLAIILPFAAHVEAAEVSGVMLEDTVRVANQELRLNGAGVRYKAIFKVYVAGLYLPEKKSTTPEVLALPGAKRLVIVTLRDVSSEELGRGFTSGIQRNLERAEKAPLIDQLMRFGEVFASVPEVRKGDTLTVDWVPGSGMVLYHNGRKLAEPIPDSAFYNALLKVWLGEKPIDEQLKPLMLGVDAAAGPGHMY